MMMMMMMIYHFFLSKRLGFYTPSLNRNERA